MTRVCGAIAAVLVLLLIAPAAAAQSGITVRHRLGTQTPFTDSAFALRLDVIGTTNAQIVSLPDVDGLTILLNRQSASRQSVNGRASASTNIILGVTASAPGRYTIPPIQFRVDGGVVESDEIEFTAIDPVVADDVVIEVEIDGDDVFVGQPTGFTIRWWLPADNQHAEYSFRSSVLVPELEVSLPSGGGTVRGQTAPATIFGVDTVGTIQERPRPGTGRDHLLFTISGLVTPTEAGRHAFGPVRVTWNRTRFRGESPVRQLAVSEPVILNARSLPGREPPGFSGLLGVHTINAAANPTAVNVGDPITLRVAIAPEDGLGLTGAARLQRIIDGPDLAAIPGFTDRFRLSPDGWGAEQSRRPGVRLFSTTIRALTDDADEIPPLPLPYFDTESGRYETAVTPAIALNVRPVRTITAADALGTDPSRLTTAAEPSAPVVATSPLDPTNPSIWAIETGPAALALAGIGAGDENRGLISPSLVAALVSPPLLIVAGVVARGVGRSMAGRDPITVGVARARRAPTAEAAVRAFAAECRRSRPDAVTAADVEDLARAAGVEAADRRTLRAALEPAEHARFGASGAGVAAEAGASGTGDHKRAIIDAITRTATGLRNTRPVGATPKVIAS